MIDEFEDRRPCRGKRNHLLKDSLDSLEGTGEGMQEVVTILVRNETRRLCDAINIWFETAETFEIKVK